jgi:phosphohistidine phosphatase SixA
MKKDYYGHPEGDFFSTNEINRDVDKILFSPWERFKQTLKKLFKRQNKIHITLKRTIKVVRNK